MSPDFTAIRCAGLVCYGRPPAERNSCSAERHVCVYRIANKDDQEWLCRCCPDCTRQCQDDIHAD